MFKTPSLGKCPAGVMEQRCVGEPVISVLCNPQCALQNVNWAISGVFCTHPGQRGASAGGTVVSCVSGCTSVVVGLSPSPISMLSFYSTHTPKMCHLLILLLIILH